MSIVWIRRWWLQIRISMESFFKLWPLEY
jgi:hypothetical protein